MAARDEDTVWTAVCVLVVAAIAGIDALVGGGLEAVLVAGPVVALTRLSPVRTAAIAALALAAGASIAGSNGSLWRLQPLLRLAAVAAMGGFCVTAARTRQRREQRHERVAEVAQVAQLAILRPVPPRVGPVAFATRYLSATEEATIGGDLYDVVVAGSDAVRLIMGDVAGKGIDAIRLAAVVLGLFREAAAVEADLPSVAKAIDSAMVGYLDDEDFVTALFVEFSAGGRITVINCGHHPPLRVGAEQVELLRPSDPGPPLGLGPHFVADTYTLGPGERLLVYTDGLVEARDPLGGFFDLAGLPERFLVDAPLDATLDKLIQRLLHHIGGHLGDDMALVLAQPLTAGELPTSGSSDRPAGAGAGAGTGAGAGAP